MVLGLGPTKWPEKEIQEAWNNTTHTDTGCMTNVVLRSFEGRKSIEKKVLGKNGLFYF